MRYVSHRFEGAFKDTFWPCLALFVTCLATFAIYSIGFPGGYLFDDTVNIVDNPNLHIQRFSWTSLIGAALSSDSGPLKRPISMLTFALNYLATGLDPYYFKLVNTAIHILNGISLFYLTLLLLKVFAARFQPELDTQRIRWVSLATAAVWMLHPFNLTTVLYVVQRMNSLAALFTIWGLILYVQGRWRQLHTRLGAIHILIGSILFLALAALCKETGLLLVLFLFGTEWIVLGFRAPRKSSRLVVHSLQFGLMGLSIIATAVYLWWHWDALLLGYHNRDFTFEERILTEGRIVWFYIRMILLPNIARMGLYHDDIPVSTGLLEPATTLIAWSSLLLLIALGILARKKAPILSFGILFFLLGQSLESTIVPLEIAHEHRNYLPSYGLLLIVAYYSLHPRPAFPNLERIGPPCLLLFILLCGVSTAIRTSYWSNNPELALGDVRHHPHSTRSNAFAGQMLFEFADYLAHHQGDRNQVENYFSESRRYFERIRKDNDNASALFALLVLDNRAEKPTDAGLVNELAYRLEKGPLIAVNVNALVKLNHCQRDRRCHLPPPVLDKLLRAILRNPELQGKDRAILLTEAAQQAVLQGQIESGLLFAREAAIQLPDDPQVRLNAASLLLETGDYMAAQREIDRARQLDTWEVFTDRIEHQEQLLQSTARQVHRR